MSFRKRAQLLVLLVAGPAFTEPLWQWLSERGGDGCVEGVSVLFGMGQETSVRFSKDFSYLPPSVSRQERWGAQGACCQEGGEER